MKFLYLTLVSCILGYLPGNRASECEPSSTTTILKSIEANQATQDSVWSPATNVIFQSNDAGLTWQDISHGLPGNLTPQGFYAGESEVYLRIVDGLYRSKSGLKTPVWEKENAPGQGDASIAFSRSGVMAYNYEGQFFQKASAAGTWLPIFRNFKEQSVETIFETSDGTVFLGLRNGLYKSADKGRSWKQVHQEGWVMDLAESDGVLIATGEKGIMRSADNGERWEWVISEGGVGIDVEHIDGGFAAISYNTNTASRRIRVSLDRGKTWVSIDAGLRPSQSISSIKQIGKYLLCGHPDGIFRSADLGKTWNIVHPAPYNAFNPEIKTWSVVPRDGGKVFKIYVSGSVLYAVANNSGC